MTTVQKMLSKNNRDGNLTINDMELTAYVTHLHICAPLMTPLEHIATKVDSTAAEIWA